LLVVTGVCSVCAGEDGAVAEGVGVDGGAGVVRVKLAPIVEPFHTFPPPVKIAELLSNDRDVVPLPDATVKLIVATVRFPVTVAPPGTNLDTSMTEPLLPVNASLANDEPELETLLNVSFEESYASFIWTTFTLSLVFILTAVLID
jgi:hypothetical protein